MTSRNLFLTLFILLVLVLLFDLEAISQCAMCRANVKTNLNNSDEIGGVGHTLNIAILYLMAIPYILISSLIYVFNKEKINAWVATKWQGIISKSSSINDNPAEI